MSILVAPTGAISSALGQLSLISSETLRQEIAGFHQRLSDFQQQIEWRADEGRAYASHVISRIPLQTSDNAAWAEADPGPDRRGILREVEFANRLGQLVYRNGRMATESADFRAHLNRILDLIDSEQP